MNSTLLCLRYYQNLCIC